MVDDPVALANSPDLDWQSVWDKGWSLAAAAEDAPVESRTADHGLPVRTPGARLVPGAANESHEGSDDSDKDSDEGSVGSPAASNGGFQSQGQPQQAAALRDPDAVRASFSSHFDGVRSGRSHARETPETHEGPDQ